MSKASEYKKLKIAPFELGSITAWVSSEGTMVIMGVDALKERAELEPHQVIAFRDWITENFSDGE